jgi:hypothetical protein
MLALRSSFLLFAAISVEGSDGITGVEAAFDHPSAGICDGTDDSSGASCLLQLKVSEAEDALRREERDSGKSDTPRVRVGVLVPSSLKNVPLPEDQVVEQFSLFTTLLPSLTRTAETTKYDYHVYVGIDAGDQLERLKDDIASLTVSGVTVEPVVVPGSDSFNTAVNYIAKKAYDAGEAYMCRVNDDTEFVTDEWTTMAVNGLSSMSPRNVGVVGPACPDGKQEIITHDFVHRKHFEMFGFYYPPVFKNWCTDDWITEVYGGLDAENSRTKKLVEWRVAHHCDVNTLPGTSHLSPGVQGCVKPRYEIGLLQDATALAQRLGCDELDSAVAQGQERISAVLAEAARSQ